MNMVFSLLTVAGQTIGSIGRRRFSMREVVRQLYDFGNGCLGIVTLCVTFMGIIIIIEYSYHMKMVIQDDGLVPGFAMVMLTRELAPAVTALLLVSKMGASCAAELGAMKTTEQLDAYRLLGLSPIDLFVAPRVLAAGAATLILAMVSLFISLIGGWLAAVTMLGFTTGTFMHSLFVFTNATDFALLAAKAVCFGASIPVISAAYGFRCRFGAEGVGMATTDAVVACSIWIIMLDFVLTFVFSALTR